jgi:signal transduction histidine kinase
LVFPVELSLFWLFLLSAILFVRVYPRLTSGVVTTSLGFAGWAAVWAIAAFLPHVEQVLGQFNEFWNAPKYILAFGMVLLLLEDERNAAEAARYRETALNQQLESFAEVTSRLLGGEGVSALCGQIARITTGVTTFTRVVVLLADEQQRMYVAGSSGVPDDILAAIVKTVRRIHPRDLAALEQDARFIGRASFICSAAQMEQFGCIPGLTQYPENPHWHIGDELLVPIRSSRGTYSGFFVLDEPRDLLRVTASEMSKLELLANDLGVAIERTYLQREIVRNEKLAGIGQLVAGMAHELNNPLTAVLGYAEIMGETAAEPLVRQQASVIHRESLRMKRIIENLVRFAKQDHCEETLLSVNSTIEEILKLWKSQAKSRGVHVEVAIEKGLPMVRFDEAQLKQVFLNILTNAFDAVEGNAGNAEKHVTVRTRLENGTVTVEVCDSGSGFPNPERAFDPFFSTKGVGKGPGLGLSVCFGIVKQHGGEIRAHNLEPNGACITVELPTAQQELALVSNS